ncbi:CLUMA_CG004300, isoform A, partial [Clunio marinus]
MGKFLIKLVTAMLVCTIAVAASECNEGFYGNHCECSLEDSELNLLNKNSKCRPDKQSLECNGRGKCVCGGCHCEHRPNPDEVVSGQFCECDNFSCDRHNGILCSSHGICECGLCRCHDGWTGDACECSTSVEDCTAPNGEICSGYGYCKCGVCDCKINKLENYAYTGKYCEH